MRNSLQYPIQKSEVVDALKQAAKDDMAKGSIGGVTAMILSDLARSLENDPDNSKFSKLFFGNEHYFSPKGVD